MKLMLRFAHLLSMVVLVQALPAQTFERKLTLQLDAQRTNYQLEWAAIDTDTLLDVVVAGTLPTGEWQLQIFQNKQNGFIAGQSIATGMSTGYFQITDWNKDNLLDILVSGTSTAGAKGFRVYTNTKSGVFLSEPLSISPFSGSFRLGDLDQDGSIEVITLGDGLKIFSRSGELRYDTLEITVSDALVFDFNRDGKNDIVMSGETEAGKPSTLVLENSGNFSFRGKALSYGLNGLVSGLDYDLDGDFDLLAVGIDSLGQSIQSLWLNKVDGWKRQTRAIAPMPRQFFTGDINSDGFSDALILGSSGGKKVNQLLDSAKHATPLDTLGLLSQQMGDVDRDGDLDIVQLKDSIDHHWLCLMENLATQNARPAAPTTSFAISAFNRTFIFWEPTEDDHTPTPTLTYDVWLGTADSAIVAPSFSLTHGRRMTVSHGNAGTSESMVIRGLTDNRYYYYIQTVDNAYNGSYSLCTGGVVPCFDLVHESIQACKDETINLSATNTAWWFSTMRGFLSIGETFSFVAEANDTIFSFVPQGADCAKNKVWVIGVTDGSKVEAATVFGCLGQTKKLGIEPGWENVTWNTSPAVVNQDSIDYVFQKNEIVVVTANAPGGCTYQKQFTLQLSQPTLSLNGDSFQMIRGTGVELVATSSATLFKWTPATSLSSDEISNPVATPFSTTQYTVTVTDSIGCTATASVLVQVEEVAFVPNLFTPNGDGKNDALLVYGLTEASNFKFQIFNREGNVVYETSSVSEVTTQGWNGTSGGTLQPNGVYYWKVEGKQPTGKQLELNGKKNGSILLVH